MSGATGVIAGAAVVGAGAAAYGASQSGKAQKDAANQANATQQGMFNTIQANEAPWVGTGQEANQALAAFYGLPGMSQTASGAGSTGLIGGNASGPGARLGIAPGTGSQNNFTGIGNLGQRATPGQGMTPGGQQTGQPGQPGQPQSTAQGAPDYNKILSGLPGYQFQLSQGTQATERNLAARGLLGSGAAEKSLATFGQGLAQNYAGQYTQGLQNLSQMGQAGAAGVATAGMNAANQIGSNSIYAGNAGAAGYANQSNAINQGLSGLVGAYQYGNQNQNPYYYYQNSPSGGYNTGYNPNTGAGGGGTFNQGGYIVNLP